MKRILCGWLVGLFVLGAPSLMAQTPDTLKILFIYGSRPARGSEGERKWFGGLNGGHVGIEINADSVLNFSPRLYYWKIFGIRVKRYRLIPVPFRKNSRFFIKTEDKTWRTFPGTVYPDSLKRRVISIPVSP